MRYYYFLVFLLSSIFGFQSCKQESASKTETPELVTEGDTTVIEEVSDVEADTIPPKEALETPAELQTKNKHALLYDFENYDKLLTLPYSLTEISGLSYHSNKHTLLAVNDEKGIIYEIDKSDGKLVSESKFGKHGDYEGIELVGDQCYIVKSNGKLHVVDLNGKQEPQSMSTGLSAMHDVEGLGYDELQNKLVLGLKGSAFGRDNKTKKLKSICSYDVDQEKIETLFNVSDEALLSKLSSLKIAKQLSKYKLKALKNRVTAFSPSAIAVNNLTNDYYVLSARGSLLVVLRESKIKDIIFLSEALIPQPEGICFDNNNHLYISTEGKGLVGKIFVFKKK